MVLCCFVALCVFFFVVFLVRSISLFFSLCGVLGSVLEWHRANLEMSNGADLDQLSNAQWDQDDSYAFLGDHSAVYGGFSKLLPPLTVGLDIQLGTELTKIVHTDRGVELTDKKGTKYKADAVVVTVPLGILKAGCIEFSPPLPCSKVAAINRLGYGTLLKVMLEFDQVFWDTIDFIGYTTRVRGRFPIFIDCVKSYDRPVLIVMCTGSEAEILETKKGKGLLWLWVWWQCFF